MGVRILVIISYFMARVKKSNNIKAYFIIIIICSLLNIFYQGEYKNFLVGYFLVFSNIFLATFYIEDQKKKTELFYEIYNISKLETHLIKLSIIGLLNMPVLVMVVALFIPSWKSTIIALINQCLIYQIMVFSYDFSNLQKVAFMIMVSILIGFFSYQFSWYLIALIPILLWAVFQKLKQEYAYFT